MRVRPVGDPEPGLIIKGHCVFATDLHDRIQSQPNMVTNETLNHFNKLTLKLGG